MKVNGMFIKKLFIYHLLKEAFGNKFLKVSYILLLINKDFEFFSVEFNNSSGYAHIIEDADSYDNNNHHDVMASILGLDKF